MRFFEITLPLSLQERDVFSELTRLDQQVPAAIISVDENDDLVEGLDEREAWTNVAEKWITNNFDDYSEHKPTAGFGGSELTEEELKERVDRVSKYKLQLENALSGAGVHEFAGEV